MNISRFILAPIFISSILSAESYTIQLDRSLNISHSQEVMLQLRKKQIKAIQSTRDDGSHILSYGSYKTREEASRHLSKLQQIVPTAFIKTVENQPEAQIYAQETIVPVEAAKIETQVEVAPTAKIVEIKKPEPVVEVAKVEPVTIVKETVEIAPAVEVAKAEPIAKIEPTMEIAPTAKIVEIQKPEPVVEVAKVESIAPVVEVSKAEPVVEVAKVESIVPIVEVAKVEPIIPSIEAKKPEPIVSNVAETTKAKSATPIAPIAKVEPKLTAVPYAQTDDPCVYRYNCGVSIKDVINPSNTKCNFITIKYNCTDPV